MTVVPGINQYIINYKTVVASGFNYIYTTIMMKQSLKNSIRINSRVINESNIVYEENVPVTNITYSVRFVKVTERELTVSTVNGEHLRLIIGM